MSLTWKDEELELLEVLRPGCSTKEIQSILARLGYKRSMEAIAKKGRVLGVEPKTQDFPSLNGLKTLAVQAVTEVLGTRTETINDLSYVTPNNPNGLTVKGVSTLTDSLGNIKMQWSKSTKESETREVVLKRLLKELPSIVEARDKSKPPKIKHASTDMLAVYPMGDPHIGLLAWKEDSSADYNLKKAESDLYAAMEYLIKQGEPTEEALIINLGDFFHTDNSTNMTKRSKNILDVDGRWPQLLRVGLACMVHCVEIALQRHQKVRVINEIGNHDDHSAIFLAVALDARYHNEPRVEVDLSPAKFHWHTFGKNFIGVTHGDTVKPNALEAIMSCDKPEEWGASEYRYWYTGHIHHQSKYEYRGCLVESFRTLAPKDAWHHSHGYRARCDMTKILLHKDFGEVFRATLDSSLLKSLKK